MNNDNTVAKYDRIRGGLQGVAAFTKPSTIKNVQTITGESETWVIETARHAEMGDTVFIECVDKTGVTRLACPPRVANAIACQREALSKRQRRASAKAEAKRRKDAGLVPFQKKKGA